jgi:hypothetical protein
VRLEQQQDWPQFLGFNSLQVGQALQQCCDHSNWGALTLGALPSPADSQAGQRLWLCVLPKTLAKHGHSQHQLPMGQSCCHLQLVTSMSVACYVHAVC